MIKQTLKRRGYSNLSRIPGGPGRADGAADSSHSGHLQKAGLESLHLISCFVRSRALFWLRVQRQWDEELHFREIQVIYGLCVFVANETIFSGICLQS